MTQTTVRLYGFDNHWASPLTYSSSCRPGYPPSGIPQYLRFLLAMCSWFLSPHSGGFLLLSYSYSFPPCLSSSNQLTSNPPTSNFSSNGCHQLYLTNSFKSRNKICIAKACKKTVYPCLSLHDSQKQSDSLSLDMSTGEGMQRMQYTHCQ